MQRYFSLVALCVTAACLGMPCTASGTVELLLCLGLICLPILIGAGMTGGQPFTTSGFLFGAVALLAAWALRQESLGSCNGSLDAVNGMYHQDDRSNGRPALTPQREHLSCDGAAIGRVDPQQEGALHYV